MVTLFVVATLNGYSEPMDAGGPIGREYVAWVCDAGHQNGAPEHCRATTCPSHTVMTLAAAMATPLEKGLQPVPMNNWSVFFYFVAFVIVVSYTLLNLYIGRAAAYRTLTPARR